jgi:hypothetical protein
MVVDDLESYFTPTNRYRQCFQESGPLAEDYIEVELTGKSLEKLSTQWKRFHSFVGDRRIIWMGGDAFVTTWGRPYDNRGASPLAPFRVEQTATGLKLFVWSLSASRAVPTCDFLLDLLAKSEYPNADVKVCDTNYHYLPLSGQALSSYFLQSNDNLGQLTIHFATLNKDHFLAIDGHGPNSADPDWPARPNLVISLHSCKVLDSAAGTFLQCLRNNRGPTDLIECEIEPALVAEALRGSRRLKRLSLVQLDESEFHTIAQALIVNQSLQELDLSVVPITDDNWSTLCGALRAHPTLEMLDISSTVETSDDESFVDIYDESKAHRMRAVAAMLWSNTVLREIILSEDEFDEQIYQDLVEPRLEMNRNGFEEQQRALKTAPLILRPKLLLRAVTVVRYNPRLVWQFLSENVQLIAVAASDASDLA